MPSFTFYGGRKRSDDKLFFLFLNLSAVPKKSAPGKLAYISYFQRIELNATKLEKTPIHFRSDVFAAFQQLCRLCVEHIEEVAKESALFVHDERLEQISVDITSWGIIQALNLRDADVDDDEDYDEGFEDEDYDWLPCLICGHLSDQVYI